MSFKTADDILGAALDEFYKHRPNALQHINFRTGVYWRPFAAFRAQTARALQRVGKLALLNSLEAEGQDLRDYVSSEYIELPETDSLSNPLSTASYGEVVLTRPTALTGGVIPKGTRLQRLANLTTEVPWDAASYETLSDVYMAVGQTVSPRIQITGTDVGSLARGNHLIRTDAPTLEVIPSGRKLFDPALRVTTFEVAGGSDKQEDDYVRSFARASAKGQYGPNADAALFGALYGNGVRNVLAYDEWQTGSLVIVVGDISWASSSYWTKRVQQAIYDTGLIGFGCQIRVAGIRNKVIYVNANVTLRDWDFTNDTAKFDEAIQTAVRSYFNNRRDWNVWKTRSLKHAITRAHPDILRCTAVTVSGTDGVAIPEISSVDYTIEQFHYQLAQKAVGVTYSGPT